MGIQVTLDAKGITFSELGAQKVREFLDAQSADAATAGLRVGVRGGGCSGFQYQLAFDERRDGDVVFEDHGLQLLVEPQSLPYVDGSVIDYVESLQGAGFQVTTRTSSQPVAAARRSASRTTRTSRSRRSSDGARRGDDVS